MTDAKVNYNFEESYVNIKHKVVNNTLSRKVEHLELVYIDGYFGEVKNFDGIANGASGTINIDSEREIRTTQINTSDTFVVGGVVYFVPGSSVPGKLRAGYVAKGVPVGICTYVNAATAIGFKPFKQTYSGPNGIKATEYVLSADAATAAIVITGLIPVGAKIVDVLIKATATSASGTVQLKTNAGTPAVITSAITCAVANALARTASLQNDVVTSDGLQILANSTADRGVITIFWR